MRIENIYDLVKDKIAKVEEKIQEELKNDVPVITRMGNHIIKSGGKRIRPALLCLAARACGYQGDRDINYGVVFEFVHTATLIHDDIIDHADLRRGKTVLNKIFGTNLSILFGDHLYNSAMRLAIKYDDFRIVKLINLATDKMITGEIIQSERNFKPEISMAEYIDLIERKTAYVFASCSQAAPILAESGEEAEKGFFNYGMNLGIAFQLIDDYFDYASSEKKLGKPVGSDLREGKITYPMLKLIENDGSRISSIIKKSFKNQMVEESDMDFLVSRMKESGALEETRQEALRYARSAVDSLKFLEPSSYKEALEALPLYVVERNK